MSDLMTLKEFQRQVETADFDEHAETLEKAITRLQLQIGAIAGAALAGPAAALLARSAAGLTGVSASTVAAREFDRMKEFLVKLYDGATAPHSFVDRSGNVIDCIPFDQLPTVKAAKKAGITVSRQAPPPPKLNHPKESDIDPWTSAPRPTGLVGPLRQGLKDPFGNKIANPPGGASFRRISLARLVRHGTLDHFHHKTPSPVYNHLPAPPTLTAPPAAGPSPAKNPTITPFSPEQPDPGNPHRYAVCQYGPFSGQSQGLISGLSSFLNVWSINPSPGGMTLSQQWLLSNVAGLGRQTIESGWQIVPSTYQTLDPILFVYFNPDNYGPRATYTANSQGEGFVPFDKAQWTVGGSLGAGSIQGGNQLVVLMVWNRVPSPDDPNISDWWLYMGSSASDLSAVGHFPGAYYAEGLPAGSGIASGADYAQFGGEVAPDATTQSLATGPMGSGFLPMSASVSDNYRQAAFQMQLGLATTGTGSATVSIPVQYLVTLPDNYDPTVYDIKYDTDASWGTYFFFGGPGSP
jgi:hypothetical protein